MPRTLTDLLATTNRCLAGSPPSRSLMRTLPITDDLESVTDIDRALETDPTSVGVAAGTVDDIWRAATNLYSTGYYPAIMLCVRRRGEVILNRAIGHADGFFPNQQPADLVPVTVRTPACIYSASKAVTAMVIHRLADQGAINLLDPVCHYIPEFGVHGKERLNIYQVLSHRGGVPGIPADEPPDTITSHKRMLELICAAKPIDEHGRSQAYHALTGGTILQEILERVTGQPLRTYWRENFKKPMALRFLDYGANRKDFALMARDYFCGARLPAPLIDYFRPFFGMDIEQDKRRVNEYDFYAQPVAGGNMIATAEELGRFFQMLLDDGACDGRQIISPLAVHRATMENSPHRIDAVLKIPMRFSAGMMMGGDRLGIFGRHTGRAFGHIGLVNIVGWADPERDLSVGLITTGKPVLAPNLPYLVLLLEAISGVIPRDAKAPRMKV